MKVFTDTMDSITQPHSYHTFLFPFKWEVYKGKNHSSYSLSQRTDLNEFIEKMDLTFWEKFTYEVKVQNGYSTYNEFAYFYEHSREALNLKTDITGLNSIQYTYTGLQADSLYRIVTSAKNYELIIEKIQLNVYENGIAVLSYFLKNDKYSEFNDILQINDAGRRLYPQYIGDTTPFTNATKSGFLAKCICVENIVSPLGTLVREDFTYYDNLLNLNESIFNIPKHVQAFLGQEFKSYTATLDKNDISICPIIDDRMFVISLSYNDSLISELANFNEEKGVYSYENHKKWYEYIFVDGFGTNCHSSKMLGNLIKDATYDRWLENKESNGERSGLIFGLSRYSFVGLASKSWFPYNIIDKHFKNQYFQLVLLSLVQRANIINFSSEVTRISQRINDKVFTFYRERRAITQLYLMYIKFVNRVFFREVTPQEQGIELYDLLHKQMRLREEVKDLDAEIQELNSYAEAQNQGQLTLIAGRFLFSSLFISLLGVDIVKETLNLAFWQVILIVIFLYFISDFLIKWTSFKK